MIFPTYARRVLLICTLLILLIGYVPLLASDAAIIEADWVTENAISLRGEIGKQVSFRFPPGGTAAPVWGSEPYTDDSSIGTAAVHSGLISFAEGGVVTIEIGEGQPSYAGSDQHGITTSLYGYWSGSYSFVLPSLLTNSVTQPDFHEGLVGYWKGNIDSIANNHMVLLGGASVQEEVLRLDGPKQSQYAVINHHPSYDFSHGYSVVMQVKFHSWFNNGTSADNQYLITKKTRNNQGDAYTMRLQITGDYTYAQSPHELTVGIGGISQLLRSGGTPSLNDWHTITVTYDTHKVRLYLDAEKILESPVVADIPPSDKPIILGQSESNLEKYRYFADISMSDMLLYTRALSDDEVLLLADAKQDSDDDIPEMWRSYELPEYGIKFNYPEDWVKGESISQGVIFYKPNFGQISIQAVKLPLDGMSLSQFAQNISNNFPNLTVEMDLGTATLGKNLAKIHLFSTPQGRRGTFSGYYLVPNTRYGFVMLTIFDNPESRSFIEEIIGSMRFDEHATPEEEIVSPPVSPTVSPEISTVSTQPSGAAHIPFTQFGTYQSRGSFGGSVYLKDIFNKEAYPVYIALYPVTAVEGKTQSKDISDFVISGTPLYTATNNLGFYRLDLPEGSYVGYTYDKNGNVWQLIQGNEVFTCTSTRKVHHFKIDNTTSTLTYDYNRLASSTDKVSIEAPTAKILLSGIVMTGNSRMPYIKVVAYLVSDLEELRASEVGSTYTNSRGEFTFDLDTEQLYVLKAGVSEQQWIQEGGLHGGTVVDLHFPPESAPVIIPLENRN
jgi:hypothetical protein